MPMKMMKYILSLVLCAVFTEVRSGDDNYSDNYYSSSYYEDFSVVRSGDDYYHGSTVAPTDAPKVFLEVSEGNNPCKAGMYLPQGQITCERCPSGKYSSDASIDCNLCPAGKYSGVYASSVCTDCPTGKYNAQKASTECTSCAAGKYNNVLGATNCADCSQSSYSSSSGASKCDECPVNEQRDVSGVCKPCSSGYYRAMGVAMCNTCSRGRYCPSDIASQNCHKGSQTSCLYCPGGYNSEAGSGKGTSCYPCPRGTYQIVLSTSNVINNLSSGICTPCPVGTYNSLLGAYRLSTGMDSTICNKCEQGKYASEEGSSICTDCSAGKYSRQLGAFSEDTCTNCPERTFSVLPGSMDCSVCPSGANSNAGATMCTYGAFVASPTSAPQSQPTIGTPLLATKQDTVVTNGGESWLQGLLIITIVLCLLYYLIRHWRKQQEANDDNYEQVDLEISKHAAGAENEHSDNPLISDTRNNITTKA